MQLTGAYCAFSWENGTNKRYFKLGENGVIEDLFGNKGHENERFWCEEAGQLWLLSENKTVTSKFSMQSGGGIDFSYWTGQVEGRNIKLKIFCVTHGSDLFENKTKFRCADLIEKGLLEVGAHTYGKPNFIDLQYGKVIIGDYCSIAGGVNIVVGNHRIDLVTTYPFATLKKFYSVQTDISDHFAKGITEIGHDVWIGQNVTIMSGVKIGSGAVLASGAVVTKNVEPYSIVGGNPARHLKYRIENAEHREQMQKIAWWNWSEEKVIANIDLIMSPNIEAFIDKFS